jgi:hypothetical protein
MELTQTRQELERTSGFLKGLYESLIEGDITNDEYSDMKRNYESRIAALTERESKLRDEIRESCLRDSALEKAQQNLAQVGGIGELTAEVIDALIEKILLFEDKHSVVTFKIKDEATGFPTNQGFVGKRTSDEADELSRLRGSEFSEVREDAAEGGEVNE